MGIKEWSKSYKSSLHDNIISHALAKAPKFVCSFEKDGSPTLMSHLMGWEYGRIWLQERDAFKTERDTKNKPKRIHNNFKWWLEKRKKKAENHTKSIKDK